MLRKQGMVLFGLQNPTWNIFLKYILKEKKMIKNHRKTLIMKTGVAIVIFSKIISRTKKIIKNEGCLIIMSSFLS